jgi:MFS transporter, DHA1 family, inner membrane transport protein
MRTTDRAALAMFALLLLSYVLNAMDRQVFPLLAPDIRREFGLGLAETGTMATILMLGMALAGMPTAWLLGRMRRRTVLLLGITLFSIATACSGTAQSFTAMLLWRGATGLGEAMQLTVILGIAANFFARHRATAIGSVNVAFGVGGMLGPYLGGVLLVVTGSWRVPLYTFGALGLPVLLILALFVRSRLSEADGARAAGTDDGADTLRNRATIVLTLLSIACGLLIYGFIGLYPTFLREVLHLAPNEAGLVMGCYGLGVTAAIAGGWLGDRFAAPRVLMPSFAITAALGLALMAGPRDAASLSLVSFFWGLVLSGVIFPNLSAYQVKAVRSRLSARATGLFVTSFYGAGAVSGVLLGSLVQAFGWQLAGVVQFGVLPLVAAFLGRYLKTHMADPAFNMPRQHSA